MKRLSTVIEELKQRLKAKSAKIKRYEPRIDQYRINRLFSVDQKKVYSELNGGKEENQDIPDADESRVFWSDIWSKKKEHNKNAQWLADLKTEINKIEKENLVINEDKVRKQTKKIPNWKAP